MEGFNWDVFKEYESSLKDEVINNNNDILKIRLLGYYDFSNQRMYPEADKIEEAKLLGEGLEYSINSLLNNENVSNKLKQLIQNPTVCIFR